MNNATNNTIVPTLRFPEFQDEEGWANKIFSQLFEIGSGKDYKHLSDGNIPVYGSGGYMLSVNDYLYEGESVCIGRKGTINKPMFLTGKFWTVDTLFYTHSFNKCLPKFIYFIFQNIDWLSYNEAGGIPSLSKTTISKIESYVPSLPEQQKIADCLSSLDELIEVESQRLEALKKHKKGLMQQLFPAEGETVPQLRFPEFWDDGEWEEKNLGDVAFLTSSKRVHLADYVSKGIPFYRGKEISLLKSQNPIEDILYISEEQYEEIKEKYGVPQIGNILITAVGTLGNVYCISSNEKFYFKDGNLIWLKDISENPIFLEILLDFYRDKVLASAIGSSQKALTISALNKLTLKFPVKPEQHKIADCLSSLDEQVATQSQQIETLKVHKKGLMQQLFPTIEDKTV